MNNASARSAQTTTARVSDIATGSTLGQRPTILTFPGSDWERQEEHQRTVIKVRMLIADQRARVERHARRAERYAQRRGYRSPNADRRWIEATDRLDDLIAIELYLNATAD